MVKRGHLNVPVIGVAKAGWNLDQLKHGRRTASRSTAGRCRGLCQAFRPAALCGRRLPGPGHLSGHPHGARRGPAARTTWPSRLLFARSWNNSPRRTARMARASSSKSPSARPRLGAGAQPHFAWHFHGESIFRIDHYLGKRPVHIMVFFRFANAFSSRSGTATMSRACRSPWRKTSGPGRGAFYDADRHIRDVVQNHLFQVLANLAMEPPSAPTANRCATKSQGPEGHPPLEAKNLVRGQFRGYSTRKAWRQTPRWKPLPRCTWRSIPGAGAASPSSEPGSACR